MQPSSYFGIPNRRCDLMPTCRKFFKGSAPRFAGGAIGILASWPNSRHLVQLGAMSYVTSTSTDSRLFGHLPRTLIDMNRSMSAYDLFASTDAWTLMCDLLAPVRYAPFVDQRYHPFSNVFWLGSTMLFFLFVGSLDQRTRVMSCTQFVSQVLPSSGESACSQWHDVGVMLDQMKRARTRFPLTVSSP
jgi:hypothetical protein